MAEIAFFSNKLKKERNKYLFIISIAILLWIIQVSIFSNLILLDLTPSLPFLAIAFLGLSFGPMAGTLSGAIISFLSTGILYDSAFCFSFPVIGFFSGLFAKNVFSNEFFLYLLLILIFTPIAEYINYLQFNSLYTQNYFERLVFVSINGTVINLIFAPFLYLIMDFLSKSFKIK